METLREYANHPCASRHSRRRHAVLLLTKRGDRSDQAAQIGTYGASRTHPGGSVGRESAFPDDLAVFDRARMFDVTVAGSGLVAVGVNESSGVDAGVWTWED